jgi:8-oxo-dGTP pyrophosphatase MutT (NUDIX family)
VTAALPDPACEDPALPDPATADRRFAGALLIDEVGRYLLQIRDNKPGILHPGAYGLFGGGVEPGESAGEAMARELEEEIGHVPDDLAPFRLVWMPVRQGEGRVERAALALFSGSIAAARVPLLAQAEGAGRALMPPHLLLLEARVALSARFGIALHAQAALALPPRCDRVERWKA